jgi:molybdenum cofactor cytidylyltransferase
MNIGIVLLAAGASVRMGTAKQQLLLDGEPLLWHAAQAALHAAATHTVVVLGAQEAAHRAMLESLPLDIMYNPDWEKGMGNSLKIGIHRLLRIAPETDAALIMVCDQPGVTAHYLNSIILKHGMTEAPVIASHYAGTLGVPALFAKKLFPELMALEDQQGAKKVIQQHHAIATTLDFPEGAVDIDTPEDYQKLSRSGASLSTRR